MPKLPNKALPANPRRVILVNPTKYLGNLLLAGGLIQDFAAQCRRENRALLVVLDAAFQDLLATAFSGIDVLWYPRQAMRRTGSWGQLRLFLDVLSQLRAFKADLAFNIEEDSLSSRLTQWSGARFRLGCSPARHAWGYERVCQIQYRGRHRWYSYQAMFAAAGLTQSAGPAYVDLHTKDADTLSLEKLHELGLASKTPIVAIHPAATKVYKQWPETAFIELCNILINNGFMPALLGAGHAEWERCDRIQRFVANTTLARPLNLCDKLSLAELAGLFRLCRGIVGNDSGPSHLASAQGLPGVVVFGPSDPTLWSPLGAHTQVLRKAELCDPGCSRRTCVAEYRCLHEIRPQEVYEALVRQISRGVAS